MDLKEVLKVLHDDDSHETEEVIDAIYKKVRNETCLFDVPRMLNFTAAIANAETPIERTILSSELDDDIGIVEVFVYRSIAENTIDAINEVNPRTYIKSGIYDLLKAMDGIGIVELS